LARVRIDSRSSWARRAPALELGLLGLVLIAAGAPATEGPLLPVAIDRKWGYVDLAGHVVIAPRFSAADRFSEGLAVTLDQGRWGFIDRTGTRVVELDDGDQRPGAFHDGRARVCYRRDDGPSPCHAIGRDGKTVWRSHDGWTLAGDFHEGRAPITDDLFHWGYIDLDGKEVVPPTYLTGSAFSAGLAVAEGPGGFSFLDLQGRPRFSLPSIDARPPHQGRAAFRPKASRGRVIYGFIADDGSVAIAPRYTGVGDFSEGAGGLSR
jgi:hypothetical protein